MKELWEATPKPPIAMVRTNGKIKCKTSDAVKPGELVMPLFFRNYTSMCVDTVDHAKPHPHHVDAEVSWPVTEHERALGNESEEHAVNPGVARI